MLGPRRVLPVALVAQDAPDVVHRSLDEQLNRSTPGEYDARFVRRVEGQDAVGLPERAQVVLDRITVAPKPLALVLKTRLEAQSLRLLVSRGLVQVAGPTPTDALHVLGQFTHWDATASEKALALLARNRAGSGDRQAQDATEMAEQIVDALTLATGTALLESAFAEDGMDDPAALAVHPLLQRGLRQVPGLVRMTAGLGVPVVGLGASAQVTYPAVGAFLNAEMLLPEHGDVANAIGAVTGRIRMVREGLVSSPSEGLYRAHLPDAPQDFSDADAAMATLEAVLSAAATEDAELAGAASVHVQIWREVKRAQIEGREMFVEARIVVEATGRPRIATHADETTL
jgi:N-methylhydantoinase A/oxoprolinase/acetone carboxylase beta subunit